MEFEWDEKKRRNNIERRGVDFHRAAMVFDDPYLIEIEDRRTDYGEDRFITVGRVDEETLAVAWTRRGEVIRIITAWDAGRDGKRRYQTLLDRRNSRDE